MTKYLDKLRSLQIGISFSMSDKVEEQRREHAADIVQPHIYDKHKRKQILNPQFLSLYPDKVRYYETPESIRKQGYPKLANYSEKLNKVSKQVRQHNVEFHGEDHKALKKIIK